MTKHMKYSFYLEGVRMNKKKVLKATAEALAEFIMECDAVIDILTW